MSIAVWGAGAFGTAVAIHLAQNGHKVLLYTHELDLADAMKATGENEKYLPDAVIDQSLITITTDQEQAAKVDYIFVAIPVPYIRSVFSSSNTLLHSQTVVLLCKGVEVATGLLPSQVLEQTTTIANTVVMSGPNFAKEMIAFKPMGITVASRNLKTAQAVAKMLQSDRCAVGISTDQMGIQVCGALKNIYSIAVGMIGGMTDSDNARMLVLTTAFNELRSLITFFGGNNESINSFAGVGDIVLSAIGSLGRNQRFGALLATGKAKDEAIAAFNSTPEGVNTLNSLYKLLSAKKMSSDYPLLTVLYRIVYEDAYADELITVLTQFSSHHDKQLVHFKVTH